MPNWILYAVLAVNLCAFSAFGLDKWKSRTRRRRIPEGTLLALSWATGAPGAWLGMQVFRHKTRKTSFKVRMALTTVFNLAWVLLWI